MGDEILTPRAAGEAVDPRHWRVVHRVLRATFRADDFATAAALVARVAEAADAANHHPDVVLRWGQVTVSTVSHDVGGLTRRDVELARAVSAIADELGLRGDPLAGTVVEVAIDALDIPAVAPFWEAVLGYRSTGEKDATAFEDADGIGPTVWFQQMDAPRPQRNRIHIDVDVPHDEAPRRIEAALAAGGHLVTDRFAPAWWVLADAEGNEACICTWQGREQD